MPDDDFRLPLDPWPEYVYDQAEDPDEPANAGNLWNREPVLVRLLFGQALATAIAFGAPLNDVQQASIMGLATAVLAVWTRRAVRPA